MALRQLKRSRKWPNPGDIFTLHLEETGWLFGRVIRTDALHSPRHIWNDGDPFCIVVYIYRHVSQEPKVPTNLPPKDLLIPPLIVSEDPWINGLLQTVGHIPLAASDVLPIHCFHWFDRYFDEYGNELNKRIEPCGEMGVETGEAIEWWVRRGLGLPEEPHVVPHGVDPGYADPDEVVLYLPGGEGDWPGEDLMTIEERLEAALAKDKPGEWTGHGLDLERGVWDVRFQGNPSKMSKAMLPVLKGMTLPKGSFLLVGGKRPKRIDL